MNTFEHVLKGKKVEVINDKPEKYEDGTVGNDWGLGFEGDWGLAIYANRVIKNAESLKDFVGEKLTSIQETENAVVFDFTHEKKIIISLEEKDWNGPEIMMLQRDNQIYVWGVGE